MDRIDNEIKNIIQFMFDVENRPAVRVLSNPYIEEK